jgi:hypothetical protein
MIFRLGEIDSYIPYALMERKYLRAFVLIQNIIEHDGKYQNPRDFMLNC